MHLIAHAGGGLVEFYPQDNQGKKINASFRYNGTRSLAERAGFTYLHTEGLHHTIVRNPLT